MKMIEWAVYWLAYVISVVFQRRLRVDIYFKSGRRLRLYVTKYTLKYKDGRLTEFEWSTNVLDPMLKHIKLDEVAAIVEFKHN